MKKNNALPVDALVTRCDAATLPFQSTDELADFADILGQSRALEALRFGSPGVVPAITCSPSAPAVSANTPR